MRKAQAVAKFMCEGSGMLAHRTDLILYNFAGRLGRSFFCRNPVFEGPQGTK
jgi:hypothetical protein